MFFPIVLETSNFLWFELPAIKKSRSSFHPYLINEMSSDEGKEEVVECNKLFSLSEHNTIYDIIFLVAILVYIHYYGIYGTILDIKNCLLSNR